MWKPNQYNKFKDQRSQPFWDLLNMVKDENLKTVVDLGCGTGELTAEIPKRFAQSQVLGIDNSDAMLKNTAALETPRLHFKNQSIQAVAEDTTTYDLIFSNAALQWTPDHEELFPRLLSKINQGGQVAIQMPNNFEHPSHRVAHNLIKDFPELQKGAIAIRKPLPVETYAQILYKAGFTEQSCREQVYVHPMDSGADVIEWTKGTMLTAFQKNLSPERFAEFLTIYSENLLKEIGEGPYVYCFRRMLLWGRKS
jgi:trans-aconitate 2-methyltransferase